VALTIARTDGVTKVIGIHHLSLLIYRRGRRPERFRKALILRVPFVWSPEISWRIDDLGICPGNFVGFAAYFEKGD
jgi:hypothetical protein